MGTYWTAVPQVLKRAVLSTLQRCVANRVYTARRGLAKGLKRRGGLGFVPYVGEVPCEEAFLRQLDLTGQTVYDIGGYVGVFTLFFAKCVRPSGHVLTFEPNPRNYERILENVRLNGFTNVAVHSIAVGTAPGRARFAYPSDQLKRGSLSPELQEQMYREKRVTTIEVEVDSLDHLAAQGLPEPDFVKIDVEGFERDVLEGMAGVLGERRPALYIELHGANYLQKLTNAAFIVETLWGAGYVVDHVESGVKIDSRERISTAHSGHLYCR